MSDDLVKRLRAVDISWSQVGEDCAAAADEIERLRTALAFVKERGDIVHDAIYYSIEVNYCANWLSDWFHGDPDAMRKLDKWRKKVGRG